MTMKIKWQSAFQDYAFSIVAREIKGYDVETRINSLKNNVYGKERYQDYVIKDGEFIGKFEEIKTTNYLVENTPNLDILGIDILETVVRKAKETYSNLKFEVHNVKNIMKKKITPQGILFAEIMWYILDDLNEIINGINKNFTGRLVIINQTFYEKGKQSYGREYFTSVDEMIDYLPWKCMEKIVKYKENEFDTHTVFGMEG